MNRNEKSKKRRESEFHHAVNLRHLVSQISGCDRMGLHEAMEAYSELRLIERRTHKWAEDMCNFDLYADMTEEEEDRAREGREKRILRRVHLILLDSEEKIPIEINFDPRGYALKIDNEWMKANQNIDFFRDWGGYGIIAPDFRIE